MQHIDEVLEAEWQAWLSRAASVQRDAARLACGCERCGGRRTRHREPRRVKVVPGNQVALRNGTLMVGAGWLSYVVKFDPHLAADLLWYLRRGDDRSVAAYAAILYDDGILVPEFPAARPAAGRWVWHGEPARACLRADVARAEANLRNLILDQQRTWLVAKGMCRGNVAVVDCDVAADAFELFALDGGYNSATARAVAERYQLPLFP